MGEPEFKHKARALFSTPHCILDSQEVPGLPKVPALEDSVEVVYFNTDGGGAWRGELGVHLEI